MIKCTGKRCPMQVGYDVANCQCKDCSYRTPPMTNYERIKAMSVEEMATIIYDGISSDPCDYCEFNTGNCNGVPCKDLSNTEIISKWLNSEAK